MAQLDINNMVLNDITVDLITNSTNTGVFDKLMSSVSENINNQYTNGRITSSDYATVYLGSLQSVLAESIRFVLQEQLSEAQVSAIIKDNKLKDGQLAVLYVDKVIKDKQAAKLGLDNIMKLSEDSRKADPAFKYTPNYIGTP